MIILTVIAFIIALVALFYAHITADELRQLQAKVNLLNMHIQRTDSSLSTFQQHIRQELNKKANR